MNNKKRRYTGAKEELVMLRHVEISEMQDFAALLQQQIVEAFTTFITVS